MPCRINKRRLWTARILLESSRHLASAFATLTYEDAPDELVPKDVQLFLKRLRKRYPGKIRFFAVGEYGDVTFRPHYHLALFGLSVLDGDYVSASWEHGFTHVGELTHDSAQYVAGYVCKKMTAVDDPRLEGRHPEFARMSLRPGIGRGAVGQIASELTKRGGAAALAGIGDVPRECRVAGTKLPLGRYLRRALRLEVGWQAETPPEVLRGLRHASSLLGAADLELLSAKRRRSDLSAKARSKIGSSKRRVL